MGLSIPPRLRGCGSLLGRPACQRRPAQSLIAENSPESSFEKPKSAPHYLSMKTPTSVLVGGGIVAAVTYGLIFRGLNRAYKWARETEEGHDQAAPREIQSYGNSDRNENVEKVPVKDPLW
jgi:hypothetical protein